MLALFITTLIFVKIRNGNLFYIFPLFFTRSKSQRGCSNDIESCFPLYHGSCFVIQEAKFTLSGLNRIFVIESLSRVSLNRLSGTSAETREDNLILSSKKIILLLFRYRCMKTNEYFSCTFAAKLMLYGGLSILVAIKCT